MSVSKIVAECRTVTPMLCSGADRQIFELRAQEIKALLRFWWRAFQPDDGRALFDNESLLFGNTERCSPFRIRVENTIPNTRQIWNRGQPHGWGDGIQYFLFPINEPSKKPKNGKPGKPASIKAKDGRAVLMPGFTFKIIILFQRGTINLESEKDVLCALWLLSNLGGIGGRSRRACGCFEITSVEFNGQALNFEDLPDFNFNKKENPEDYVKKNLDQVMIRWNSYRKTSGAPDRTAFSPGVSELWVFYDPPQAAKKATDIMEILGAGMRAFRLRNPFSEAQAMHSALSSGSPPSYLPKCTKAYLGLPIIYNFKETFNNLYGPNLKSGGKNLQYTLTSAKIDCHGNIMRKTAPNGLLGEPKEGNGRRASPLIIACHEVAGISYATILHLPAALLPPDEKLWLKPSNGLRSLDVFQDASGRPSYSPGLCYANELLGSARAPKGRIPLAALFNKRVAYGL